MVKQGAAAAELLEDAEDADMAGAVETKLDRPASIDGGDAGLRSWHLNTGRDGDSQGHERHGHGSGRGHGHHSNGHGSHGSRHAHDGRGRSPRPGGGSREQQHPASGNVAECQNGGGGSGCDRDPMASPRSQNGDHAARRTKLAFRGGQGRSARRLHLVSRQAPGAGSAGRT